MPSLAALRCSLLHCSHCLCGWGAFALRVLCQLPVAARGGVAARTWRDALLALKTRDSEHVVLGPVLADGSGSIRDMSEGVLLRLFHALEMLYPTALVKEGALRWRVRPRGAAHHHMLACLEQLGRGAVATPASASTFSTLPKPVAGSSSTALAVADTPAPAGPPAVGGKRPRRASGATASKAAAQMAASAAAARAIAEEEEDLWREELWDPDVEAPPEVDKKARATETLATVTETDEALPLRTIRQTEHQAGEHLPLPLLNKVKHEAGESLPLPPGKTQLWAHQEASANRVVEGVREGRRGHADASAVGAGKTLTALSTIVKLAAFMEESGTKRNGVLVMLPTKALIKEWLLEIAAHTSGFHVIEQREDGSLFSLTYGRSTPPIDANSLIISTLDRVCGARTPAESPWCVYRGWRTTLAHHPCVASRFCRRASLCAPGRVGLRRD
jgi:hypothetical protein